MMQRQLYDIAQPQRFVILLFGKYAVDDFGRPIQVGEIRCLSRLLDERAGQ